MRNWGRILCAMGYSGAQFDPEKVDLFFESAAGKMQIEVILYSNEFGELAKSAGAEKFLQELM